MLFKNRKGNEVFKKRKISIIKNIINLDSTTIQHSK